MKNIYFIFLILFYACNLNAQCSFTITQLPSAPSCGQATLNVATPVGYDQVQTSTNTCMANLSQSDLAQSFVPTQTAICGAGIQLINGPGSGTLTITLYNNLPTLGGTVMATGSTTLSAPGFYDVTWPSVSVVPSTTYYLVFVGTSGISSYCIAGSTSNPYANGMTYANSGYNPFSGFDYTFRTKTCGSPTINYLWSTGATTSSLVVNNSSPVNLTLTIPASCTNSAIFTPSVLVSPTITASSGSICNGSSFTIVPSGASSYTYQGGGAVKNPTITTTYTVIGTNSVGCLSNIATSTVSVNSNPTIAVNSGSICSGNTFTILPSGASTYTIQGGSVNVTPTANTSYTVAGTSSLGCISANTATSNVIVNAAPTLSVNSGAICLGNSFTITPTGASTYTYSGGSAVVSPTATASYTVTGTNTVGCNGSAVSNVTVNALPTVSAASSNTAFICVGSSATLTATGASSYVWNTTATTAVIAVSPTTTTSYTVTGTNAAGCSANAVVSQSVSTCTGINSNFTNLTSNLIVYPNPSSGVFNVQLETSTPLSLTTIEVTDVLGRVILTDNVNAGVYELNLGNNVNGVYFIKATFDGKTKTVKIVKE